MQALAEGQWITLVLAGGGAVRGRTVAVDDTSVTVAVAAAAGGGTRHIDRSDIVSVKAEATRRMVVGGLLIAGAAGLLIANAVGRPAEALPGKLWFAGVPLAVVGGTRIHREMRRTGVIYRQP